MPYSIVHGSPQEMPRYDWLEHQRAFLQCPAKYVAFVGGMRSGKTVAGAYQAIKLTQLYPGSKGLIGRLTAKALGETTQDTLFKMIPKGLIADWRSHEQHLWLNTSQPNVFSEILFYHLDDPGPLGSLELDWWWIDEAHEPDGSEVPETTFKTLQSRLSGHNGPNRGFVTSNPGGHDWIYKYFVTKEAVPEKLHDRFACFTVKTSENLANLPEDYSDQYAQHTLPDGSLDEWGRRFLDASFDVFEGQIYPGFSERTHVRVPEPWRKNGHQIRVASLDFGIRNATCVLDGFVDFEGILWIDDEFYKPNGGEAVIPDAAAWMRERGIDRPVADPSTQNRAPDGKSVADRFAHEHIYLNPGNNTLMLGIEEVRRRLQERIRHPEVAEYEYPMLCIHPRCTHLIRELKQYRWAPDKTGTNREQPLKRDDHAADALRYLVMAVRYGERAGLPRQAVREPWNRVHPARELRRSGTQSRYERNWG